MKRREMLQAPEKHVIASSRDIKGLPGWNCEAFVWPYTASEEASRMRLIRCDLFDGNGDCVECKDFPISFGDERVLGEIGDACVAELCRQHQSKPARMGTRTHP